MRKIFIILLSVALFSCSDDLEQVPTNKLPSSEAISTVSDLQSAVNGVYSTLVDQDSYCGYFGLYADGKGGDLDYLKNYGHFATLIDLQTNKNSDLAASIYEYNYVAIARVNDILTIVESISDKDENIAEYNDLLGQLHAIRGLLHMDLLRTYCPMPNLVADQTAAKSGIVISKEKYSVNATFTRSTMKESYDFVKAEFAEALKTIGKDSSLGELNFWAVEALRARMLLSLGEYSAALADAVDVIDNSGYSLLKRDEWVASWSNEEASETLFEIRTSDTDNAQRESLGYFTNPEGYQEAIASEGFITFYNTLDANDIRRESIKEETDAAGDFKAFYPQKYRGRAGVTSPTYVNNPKVIRLSEVYYIAAEALLKGATATGALTAVEYYNAVRENRISGYTAAANVTINDIMNERRIELFCENSRMFDLIRNVDEFSHPRFATPLKVNDSRLVVEIPQRELDINPDL